MRNIKLFLASGNTLKKDRDEIMLFLANKNQFLVKHGIFLELVRWEFLSSSFSETRKQDDFNKELEESEIFTCLIFDHIGQYTREEFDKAYQNYKQGKNPRKFYLYFKTLPKGKKEEAIEVYEFRQAIEKDEQIYREYKNPDQLKLFLNQNLDEDLPEIFKEALLQSISEPETKTMTETIPNYILDNLDEADKLLNKNLTEEALEIYQDALKQVNKKTDPVAYSRIQLGIGACYINLSYLDDQEKNQIKAMAKFESVLESITPEQDKQTYLSALLRLSTVYSTIAAFRDRKKNTFKAIELAEKVLSFQEDFESRYIFFDANRIIGTCYVEIMILESQKDLFEKAQTYLSKAITYIDKKLDYREYAEILTEIAQSYDSLAFIELDKEMRIQHLHESIRYSEEALSIDTIDEDAFLYVRILNNISSGYFNLYRINLNVEHILKALEYNKKVLNVLADYQNSVAYLTAMSNNSMILMNLFDHTKEIHYLDEAIKINVTGLEKATLQTQPIRYSKFHVNLGMCYLKKADLTEVGSEKTTILKKAIDELETASNIFTRSQFLIGHKTIRIHLAKCYIQLSKLEDKELNLAQAQKAINDFLECYVDKEKDGFYENAIKLQDQINQEKSS